jgi:hypothetical protein
MTEKHIIAGGILLIALLCGIGAAAVQESSADLNGAGLVPGDIRPFEGPIGADNPLHGLKLALEDLDETFTFNNTRRVEKQVIHAQLRIAEFRSELELNRTRSADRVLDLYWQKLNRTEGSLAAFGSDEPGLLQAQEMIALHQTVLGSLLQSHPDIQGLSRAYNNSLSLGERFSQKTAMKFTRVMGKDNKTIIRTERADIREQSRAGNNVTPAETMMRDKNENREKTSDQKNMIAGTTTVTPKPGNREEPGKKKT